MKKKSQSIERPDGSIWWTRLFIPLRGGHYNYEWTLVRIEGNRVRMFASQNSIPLDAPVLENAMWSGPIEPPPLEAAEDMGLALEQATGHRKRSPGRWGPTASSDREPGPVARAVAGQIVDGFIGTVESLKMYYREHADHRIELVEKIAALIERAIR